MALVRRALLLLILLSTLPDESTGKRSRKPRGGGGGDGGGAPAVEHAAAPAAPLSMKDLVAHAATTCAEDDIDAALDGESPRAALEALIRENAPPPPQPQGSAAARPESPAGSAAMEKFNAAQQLLQGLQRAPQAQREHHADAIQAEQLFDTGVAQLGNPTPPQPTQLSAIMRISSEYGKAGLRAARLRSLKRLIELGGALPPATLDSQAQMNIGIAAQNLDMEFDELPAATRAYRTILRRWAPLPAPL